jgi:hypothetical protein
MLEGAAFGDAYIQGREVAHVLHTLECCTIHLHTGSRSIVVPVNRPKIPVRMPSKTIQLTM